MLQYGLDLRTLFQSQKKTNALGFHWYEAPRAIKFLQTESRMVVTKVWGLGGGLLFYRTEFPFLQEENVVEMVVHQCECT